MADDLEQLVLTISADTRQIQRQLKKLSADANKETKKIEDSFDKMSKNVSKSLDFSGAASRALGALGVGIGSAASLQAVSAAAQQFTDLQNALKVTGLEGAELEKTFSALFQIAQKNGTEIAPLTTLYSRASQAQKELGASSADLLKFTDGVSVALRVAGSSSAQASGALLQLSQAIGGGIVRAEEFNSVNEGARPILQAVAAGLEEAGGSVSKLKTLVNDGKVSSEAFFRAFLAGMPQLEAQVAKADGTIGQATARIGNAFVVLVGTLDKMTGASKSAAGNLSALGGVLENLPGYFDAATKKLETFQSYLTQLGNSSVWSKIAAFMGADLSPEGLRKAGITPPQDFTGPAGRIAEGARDPLGQAAAAPAVKPVSLKDFNLPGEEEEKKSRDAFERSTAAIQKRIALMNSEVETIGLSNAARERAKAVIELETAARQANEKAGLGQNVITQQQRAEIDLLAESYGRAAEKVEEMNSPLNRLARSSADTSARLNELAADSLAGLADEMVDVINGTQSVGDAFKKMTVSILNDLARIALRQAIMGSIGSALGGLFGGGSGGPINMFGGAGANFAVPTFGRAGGGPVAAGQPIEVGELGKELFVPNVAGRIIPNHKLENMNGPSVNLGDTSIVIQGSADQTTLAIMRQELAKRDAEQSSRIVAAVREARTTRNLR